MNARIRVDILVAGLGPAGATAAAAAARADRRVLAIDRKRQAGLPVQCAEFVPAMIGPLLEADQTAAVRSSWRQGVRAMHTFVEDDAPHLKEHFPGHMIDRAAFDAALVAAAVAEGAECRFGVGLSSVDTDGTARLSDGRAVEARVIIGADGPRSPVGRAIGQVNRELAETRQITIPLLKPFDATDIFLSARISGGYAWLFPKADRANLGLGIAPEQRHLLKPLLDDLHRQLVAEGRVGRDVLGHTGGAIPVGGMLHPQGEIGRSLVLLAGDAAGLTNPITGAGINPAVISGRLAGLAAAEAVGGTGGACRYAEELEDLFKSSLDRALARRRQLMHVYADGGRPSRDELQRSWIAFPQYWAAA
ncbi:MAG: NAD(P)/FAD-dependent oxidoreductase [Hyphomicrobiaceae bacterium]|nr:MAG: NAD(P)/FAD-dependent oxidoreductase [Hyphomicrobiaceae bacterium]